MTIHGLTIASCGTVNRVAALYGRQAHMPSVRSNKMETIANKKLLITKFLTSIFLAIFAIPISSELINYLHDINETYDPFSGLEYSYLFWQYFLSGVLCVCISYSFLYNEKNNAYLVACLLLIHFIIDAFVTYRLVGEPYLFKYEVILGGLIIVALFETIKKVNASNK